MEILREYAQATTILFPILDTAGQFFEDAGLTFAAADSKISKDEAAFANTGSSPSHEGEGIYSLALTSGEMTAKRIVVTVRDVTALKVWADQAIIIQTFGSASAEIQFDLQDSFSTLFTAKVPALEHVYGVRGTISDAGPTTTDFDGDTGLQATNDFYNGHILIFDTDAANPGIGRRIDEYISGTRNMLFSEPWPITPVNGDAFTIISFHTQETSAGGLGLK